ncbi:hypothetical protein [Sphingobacterium yanglingense]|uniref:Uncharacterized protein n=1 Tax=Sphingobacterium yanglingense TaxID=1437280 RepID=A0A4V3DE40_9SPHI|nr:hypothetical protein [Sphingobacterium yanglingense]TDQ79639.1 hypothetical protein CLV99_1086 [Sphingobacterium yanglingense]
MGKEIMLAIMSTGLFTAITLSIYFIMKFRAIRTANADETPVKREPYDWQKPGIVVLGIGVGIVVVGIFKELGYFQSQDAIPMGIITVCTGISMIIANKLDKKQETNN